MKRTHQELWVTVFLSLLRVSAGTEVDETAPKFRAAVYEHVVTMPSDPKENVTRAEALSIMRQNLATYAQQAQAARAQGANIIVFPEDGLYGVAFSRESIQPYLEYIPDPKVETWVPCDEPDRFPNTEVQEELSCMAKNHSIFIVANMGDRQPCHPQVNANCRKDGYFQYNTDVAFDPNGRLVARYHKKNLFFEYQFDEPRQAEVVSFQTPFGRWGMFTCFDILFYSPAVEAVVREGIANIAFPTAWMDALPLLASVQFHSAFARGLGVNFLAANIHWPAYRFQGSGIYTPTGMADFYHNASISSEPRLIVAEIEILTKPSPEGTPTPRNDVNSTVSFSSSNVSSENVTGVRDDGGEAKEIAFVSFLFHDLFNFVQLIETKGALRVCHEEVCCSLDYELTNDSQTDDLFAFGAFDGLHTHDGQYYLQICALVRCANQSRQSCGSPTNQSSTLFQRLAINGSFSTEFLYPEVLLTSQGNYLRLAEASEWSFHDQIIKSDRGFAYPLLSAAIFGRDYFRDNTTLPLAASAAPRVTPLWAPVTLVFFSSAALRFWGNY